MKNIVRRTLGAVLAVGMTTALLSGCGGPDPIKDVMGYSGSTVMLTVNGKKITAEEYLFWLGNQADQAMGYLSMMAPEDGEQDSIWDLEIEEGVTAGDNIKESAKQYAVTYCVVAEQGKEKGYTYTDEDKKAYEEELAKVKEQMGGEEAFQTWLKSTCITEKGFEKMSSVSYINKHMVEGMFREGAENAPTPEDLAKYAKDNNLLAAKHILLLTKDMKTGKEFSQEVKDQKKAKAEELLAQLQAVTDPAQLEAKFDELMKANSEDSGLETAPDGYVFGPGEMVEEFETATKNLEPGKISGIVQSDYGYHIVLRLDPVKMEQIRSAWGFFRMDEMTKKWVEEAQVETTETYDNLSVKEFYEKLTAYRQSLMPKEEPDAPAPKPEEGEEQKPAEGADGKDNQPAEDQTTPPKEEQGKTEGGQAGQEGQQPADKPEESPKQ